jgi:peptidoglycan hydrolase-like protein with peptidoglycan-binding domain
MQIAASQIGYSRWDDPERGTKYGRWFAEVTGNGYYAENGVPYCAMFASWVLAQAGQQCAGFPGAYCPTMLAAARRAGLAVDKHSAKAGDVVFFDWGNDGETDHVGFVEMNCGGYLQTIEGNTSSGASGSQGNGGTVARRTRSFGVVCGVIRPPYEGGGGGLAVDGWIGAQSVSTWQRVMGTPVDGVISGQSPECAEYLPNVVAITYDDGGSLLVEAVQRATGAVVDGYMGPNTVRALQRHLDVYADGYLGPKTAMALQSRLKSGRF